MELRFEIDSFNIKVTYFRQLCYQFDIKNSKTKNKYSGKCLYKNGIDCFLPFLPLGIMVIYSTCRVFAIEYCTTFVL